MNSLIKSKKLATLLLKNPAPSITAVRNHWNKDYKPGPYPKTEEEFKAAAAKYNLLEAEYQPYPDDGDGYGDYPKLPIISADSKDPFYPWDNPELKRNFNEPLHAEFDLITEDRYNYNLKLHKPISVLWMQFFGVMGCLGFILWLSNQAKMFPAVTPPQIPKEGKVYYTFESP